MKKRRGLKRYYRKLHQCNEWDYWCDMLSDESDWCNFAHQHFDWGNYGDICWKEHKEHLDILFKHFSMIEQHVKNVERPFQMFAILHLNDSGQDALYFHTPNPYTEFPYIISQKEFKIGYQLKYPPLGKYLAILIEQGYTVFSSEKSKSCIVFKENVGETLYNKLPYQYTQEIIILAKSDKQAAILALKKYLTKYWYRGHNNESWYNLHKKDINSYYGYWSFESGALVKILGLDDSSLKEVQYYPYDMIHWNENN